MRDRDGRTPLHMACTYGFKEAVEWLVEEGKCNVGESCLYSTCTWNPSITDTFGEQCFGLYTEVAFVEMLFCTNTNCSFRTWVPGRYIATGLYSEEVVVNRGSTVVGTATANLITPFTVIIIFELLISCSDILI